MARTFDHESALDAAVSSRGNALVRAAGYVLPAAAAAAVLFATAVWGPVVTWDSVVYLRFAESGTQDVTMSFFCPLFPFTLTALGRLGLSGPAAARVLNSLLFGATVALAMAAVRRGARWLWTPVLAGLLVLTSRVLLEQYVRVMSDPLGLVLGYAGLLLVCTYLDAQRPETWRLLLCGVVFGLALATRYACLPFLATGVAGVLLLRKAPWSRRLLEAGVLVALAMAPLAVWLGRNVASTGGATNREIGFHLPNPELLSLGLRELTTWILPARLPAVLRYATLAVVVAAVIGLIRLVRRHPRRAPSGAFDVLLPVFLLFYALFLVAVNLFLDATVTVGTRHWLPVYFGGLLLLCRLLDRVISEPLLSTTLRRQIAAGVGAFLLASAALTAGKGWLLFRDGGEYSRRAMAASVLHRLREAPWAGRPVYASDPEAVTYVAGVPAERFPVKYYPMNYRANPKYASELTTAKDALRNRGGITVRMPGLPSDRLPSLEDLEGSANLEVVARDETATIYARP